jgi:hypothetical protein
MADILYETKYCTIADVTRETQIDYTTSTKPSTNQIAQWIEDLEREIDAALLGWGENRSQGEGYLATNVYLDIKSLAPRITPIDRFRLLTQYSVDPYFQSKGAIVLIPDHYRPIIDITSMWYTNKELDQTPEWTAVTQGYYEGWTETSGTDFKLEHTRGRAGQLHVSSIWFYSSTRPDVGRARLKSTFTYGWNLPLSILRTYCANIIAAKTTHASVTAGEPTALASFTGGDFQDWVNTEVDNQVQKFIGEALRIKKEYFPKDPAIGILTI